MVRVHVREDTLYRSSIFLGRSHDGEVDRMCWSRSVAGFDEDKQCRLLEWCRSNHSDHMYLLHSRQVVLERKKN